MNLRYREILCQLCLGFGLCLAQIGAFGAETTLKEVSVVGDAMTAEEERQSSSTGKIVIDRAQIEQVDAITVADLLRSLPGANLGIPPSDGRRSGPRGGGQDRLMPKLLVDGEPLGGGPGGVSATLRLPPELIERIEIIRNSTAEFPSGPGGTINLILRDTPLEKAVTAKGVVGHDGLGPTARASLVYGDREGMVGQIWTLAVDRQSRQGERTLTTENFSTSAVTKEQDAQSGHDLGLHLMSRITVDLGGGERLILTPMFYGSELRRTTQTTLSGSSTGSEADVDATTRATGRVSGEWKKRYGGAGEAQVRASLYAMDVDTDGLLSVRDASGSLTSQITSRTRERQQGLTVMAKRTLPLSGQQVGSAGVDLRYRVTEDRQTRSTLSGATDLGASASSDAAEKNLAVWAQDEVQVSPAQTITPGLRLEYSGNSVTDALATRTSLSQVDMLPSVHWLYRLSPEWNLRASLAQTVAQPSVSQLSAVVHTATGTNSLANPDRSGNSSLQREKTLSWQVGSERFFSDRRGSAGLNLFYRDISDKVIGRTSLESGRYVERPTNAAAATETSLVFDAKWRPPTLSQLELRGNLSGNRLYISDLSGSTIRQESPRYAANSGFEYRVSAPAITLGGNLTWRSSYTREASSDSLVTLGSTHQLDLYATRRLDKALSLRLSLNNLTAPDKKSSSQTYSSGVLATRETDSAPSQRSLFMSIEGKW